MDLAGTINMERRTPFHVMKSRPKHVSDAKVIENLFFDNSTTFFVGLQSNEVIMIVNLIIFHRPSIRS